MSSTPETDTPPVSRASLVLRQLAIVLLGLVLAAVMVGLGLWQLGVYNAQGHKEAEERASAPAVALDSVARPGQQVGDAYGRQVSFSGSYDPALQELIPTGSGDRYRVLTGLRLPDGGILPVVRGMVAGRNAPAPPTGQVSGTGIFMPSEGSNPDPADPSAQPTTVVLPTLTQQWNGLLVNGFATLGADQSRAQSLPPVVVSLPSSHGRLQNGFYALQWWVFAAFAIWFGVRMARDFGRNGGLMGAEMGGEEDTPSKSGARPGTVGESDSMSITNPAAERAMSARRRQADADSAGSRTTT